MSEKIKKISKTDLSFNEVPLSKIDSDPDQPRQEFDLEAMNRLKESIRLHGIRRPLALEKKKNDRFLIIDGERRYRCAKELGLKSVPATIEEEMTPIERTVYRFNVQETTQNWSYFDKARAIYLLKINEDFSVAELSSLLGMSTAIISDYIAVMQLSRRTIESMSKAKMPFSYATEIVRIIRTLTDAQLRQQFQDNLVERFQRKEFMKRDELSDLRKALNSLDEEEREKMVKLIIKTSTSEILEKLKKEASIDILNSITKLMKACSKFERALIYAKMKKGNEYLEERQTDKLTKLISKIKTFLE